MTMDEAGYSRAFSWKKEQYDALPEHVRKIRGILQEYYLAMEDGSIEALQPGSPSTVTLEYADKLVEYLDESYVREIAAWAHNCGYDAPPGFSRLTDWQRCALAEEVATVLRGVPPEPEKAYYYGEPFCLAADGVHRGEDVIPYYYSDNIRRA